MSTNVSPAARDVCWKITGIAEEGNSCLQTPGTCESCPEWSKKSSVRVVKASHEKCGVCGKNSTKRKGTFAAPIVLVLGRDFSSLCMKCAKRASSLLDAAIESIESKYPQKPLANQKRR